MKGQHQQMNYQTLKTVSQRIGLVSELQIKFKEKSSVLMVIYPSEYFLAEAITSTLETNWIVKRS